MTKEENDLLTQTGPGTPCGELLRRYWQPAALSEELPPGGPPLPIKLLGEELVLFRDDKGQPGLLALHCSHRGADLSYGRLEDGGLRCIYHGWLYDSHGRVLDRPGEVDGGARVRDSIRHLAYPCQERAGVIFAYLGPDEPPLFPNYEFLSVPENQAFAIKLFSDCNYLQGNEGNLDLGHLSFLHYNSRYRPVKGDVETLPGGDLNLRGAAPEMESYEAELTPYGVRSYKIHRLSGSEAYLLSMTEFVVPNLTTFYGPVYAAEETYSVNWHVPIDDEHHWKYNFIFSRKSPPDKEAINWYQRIRAELGTDYKPVRNKANRYLQDRSSMRKESYTGIGFNFQIHDLYATEGQGQIQERAKEHLTSMDRAIVVARKVLVKAIRDLQEGREPANVVRDAKFNHFLLDACDDMVPNSTPWKEYIRGKEERLKNFLN